MAEREIAVMHRWFDEMWNKGRAEAMEELVAPDVIAHGFGGPDQVLRGADALKKVYRQLYDAFPDLHMTVEEAVSERDIVAVRWIASGTHTGDTLGFAATGKRVTVTGMTFCRFVDGKIAEGWDNWDMMGLMNTLGQTPHATVAPG